MLASRTISISIKRRMADVYAYLAQPANMPSWTTAAGPDFTQLADRVWVAEAHDDPRGPVTVTFCALNEWGVLDYQVSRQDEDTLLVPMRVVPNEEGCDLHFTYFQRPGITDEQLDSEVEWVHTDLLTLKALLEAWAERK